MAKTKDLTQGSVWKLLLVFAFPTLLSNVFQPPLYISSTGTDRCSAECSIRAGRVECTQIAARGGGVRGSRASGVGSVNIGSLWRGDIAGAAFDHGKARCVRVDCVGADRGVLELQERGHGAALVGNRSLAGYEGRGCLGGLLFLDRKSVV